MLLTFKQKHTRDYTDLLRKAKQVAEYAISEKDWRKRTSRYVSHVGLPSAIANQVLRKYGRDLKTQEVQRIKLVVPGQAIQCNREKQEVYIPCLDRLRFSYDIRKPIPWNKIHQIEIDNHSYYISVEVEELPEYETPDWLGVDCNTTGHCVVAASPKTRKVMKLGKKAHHIHDKYKHIRKRLQQREKYQALRTIKRRERHIVRDLNHKITTKLVKYALENHLGIKMEDLEGIRQTVKCNHNNKDWIYSLNSWSYDQLQRMVVYKARLLGVPVLFIPPAYTSQACSQCHRLGKRNGKQFKCPSCGHTGHADVNAAFNIAEWPVEAWLQRILGGLFSAVRCPRMSDAIWKALRSGGAEEPSEGGTDPPQGARGSQASPQIHLPAA